MLPVTVKPAGVTVIAAVAVKLPLAALIVAVPRAAAVAKPVEVTEALAGLEEVHVTALVTFCWVPLLNTAVAVNCWVWPMVRKGAAGVMEIPSSVGAVTVRLVEALMLRLEALTAVVPGATPVAKPALVM